MSVCWADPCESEGKDRFIVKPLGTFSVAGTQPKLVGTRYVLCDAHWELVQMATKNESTL